MQATSRSEGGSGGLFDLSGRTALVTGACGGIGKALCFGLAQHGAKIIAVDRFLEPIEGLVDELSRADYRAIGLSGDLRDPLAPARIVRDAVDACERVDILVNNAGVNNKAQLEVTEADAWSEMFAVNVTACFLLSRATVAVQTGLGLLLSIVNISSVAGSSALGRGNAGFGASKAGLNELTRELAVEWAPRGVRVNAIQPSQVNGEAFQVLAETGAGRRLIDSMIRGIPAGRFLNAEELVGPVVFLASDASRMVTGAVLPVDGGNLALNAGGTIGEQM